MNTNMKQLDGIPEDGIRIERIKVKDLPEFAQAVLEKTREGQFVPITMQRAVAHAHNPNADESDVGLLAAVDEEGDVVGYFGILPIILRRGDTYHKVHWFTTWSVSSKVRGKGVGTRLMAEALKLNYDFLIVGSIHARRVCQKFKFWEREPFKYYWLDTSGMGRLNPLIWLRRVYRKTRWLLRYRRTAVQITTPQTEAIDRIFSPLTKWVFYGLLARGLDKVLNEIRIEQVTEVRNVPPTRATAPAVELYRGAELVNWMLIYPWIAEPGGSMTDRMDYYFSDVREMYRFISLELNTPEGEYLGFVVYSVSKKADKIVLRTLDYQLTDLTSLRYVYALAIKYGKEYKADIIEMPLQVGATLKGSLLGRILLEEKKRIYQCMPREESSPLAKAWSEIVFQIPDGDMAFS
jgi:GNAT superfamily N-acetyltransferase